MPSFIAATCDVVRHPKDDRPLPFWEVNHTQDGFSLKLLKPGSLASTR